MGDLTKNFSRSEIACRCGCGYDGITLRFTKILQEMRNLLGEPMIITSGCRCINYNRMIGGFKNSAHTRGLAVDIKCTNSYMRRRLILLAIRKGITRIGIGKDFIHIDIDDRLPQEVFWLY